MSKYYIARDKDGRLFKYPYRVGMTATDIPHKHVSAYPFDGNYYAQGRGYMPKKGEEIDGNMFSFVTYENSPILVKEKESDGMAAIGYLVPNPNFTPKGEYKETELDRYKRSVDFLITSCCNRYEIIFNKPIVLKETRSIKRISSNGYLVTEKALESLKKQYTSACDF